MFDQDPLVIPITFSRNQLRLHYLSVHSSRGWRSSRVGSVGTAHLVPCVH
jgi:hypothetical protein